MKSFKMETVSTWLTFFLILLSFSSIIFAQSAYYSIAEENPYNSLDYGYGYDSLLADLNSWSLSPYVEIDSIGRSVLDRGIWMLTIRGEQGHSLPVYRVTIHARTHPNEPQSEWLTNRIVAHLLARNEFANFLRDRFVFNIIPMINPDGVELQNGRLNANNIDLERNWFTYPHEPEVEALKSKYYEFMNSSIPIRVALNMHGDGGAVMNYFFCHHQNGTSAYFFEDQKSFIASVRNYYPNGIHPWNYSVTWATGNPMLFPESWFWVNYAEAVMALTFEKTTALPSNVSEYDSAAYALLRGIVDYLGLVPTNIDNESSLNTFSLCQNYPNPFNPATNIRYSIPDLNYQNASGGELVTLKIYDILGTEIETLVSEQQSPGVYEVVFDGGNLPSGTYIYRFFYGGRSSAKKMILLK